MAPLGPVSVSVRMESIGSAWRTGAKASANWAVDALRRRIRQPQLGMTLLERLQFAEQPVILGVRNQLRVEDVVVMIEPFDFGAQAARALEVAG